MIGCVVDALRSDLSFQPWCGGKRRERGRFCRGCDNVIHGAGDEQVGGAWAQVRSTGPESGGRTCKQPSEGQNREVQSWQDTATNEGRGGARLQRPGCTTPASTAFAVQPARHHPRVFWQDSVRYGFAFESNHSGSSDVSTAEWPFGLLLSTWSASLWRQLGTKGKWTLTFGVNVWIRLQTRINSCHFCLNWLCGETPSRDLVENSQCAFTEGMSLSSIGFV